jgi:hypothetical protein
MEGGEISTRYEVRGTRVEVRREGKYDVRS